MSIANVGKQDFPLPQSPINPTVQKALTGWYAPFLSAFFYKETARIAENIAI
jgi:hypothetical protein